MYISSRIYLKIEQKQYKMTLHTTQKHRLYFLFHFQLYVALWSGVRCTTDLRRYAVLRYLPEHCTAAAAAAPSSYLNCHVKLSFMTVGYRISVYDARLVGAKLAISYGRPNQLLFTISDIANSN